jgi:hypothetical protein
MPFTRVSTNGISNKNATHLVRLRSSAAWNFFRTYFYNEAQRLPSTGLFIPNLPNTIGVLKSLNRRQKKMKRKKNVYLFWSGTSRWDEHTKQLGNESVNRKPLYVVKFHCYMLRLVYKISSSGWQDPKATKWNTLYNFTQCMQNHTHHLLPSLSYDRPIASSNAHDPVRPLSMASNLFFP